MAKKNETVGMHYLQLVFDTETTGLVASRHDVVQIAGVVLQYGLEVQRFVYTCKPHRWDTISPEAIEVNGHTLEKLKTYDRPEHVVQAIKDILDSYKDENERIQLVAHNMPFDYRMTQAWWEKSGYSDFHMYFMEQDDCICTKKWGNRANKELGWGLENGKLTTFAEFLNYHFDAHDALGDTLACYRLMQELVTSGMVVPMGGPTPSELHEEGKKTMDEMEVEMGNLEI